MEKMISVKYDGPAEQISHEVGIATGGSSIVTPGATYELPEELAIRLVDSTEGWAWVGKPPARAGLAAMNANAAAKQIAKLETVEDVAAARATEQGRTDGGRITVLAALDDRQAELEPTPAAEGGHNEEEQP